MIVDLVNLGSDPVPFDFTLPPEEVDVETEGVTLSGNVSVEGELRKRAAGIEVDGHVTATLEIACTRCLTPITTRLDFDFHAGFVSSDMFPADRETQVSGADLDTDVVESDELDLTKVVREQILLNLPVQVFCRDDCKGICPMCGTDLNESACNCGRDDIDPRWAALKDLK